MNIIVSNKRSWLIKVASVLCATFLVSSCAKEQEPKGDDGNSSEVAQLTPIQLKLDLSADLETSVNVITEDDLKSPGGDKARSTGKLASINSDLDNDASESRGLGVKIVSGATGGKTKFEIPTGDVVKLLLIFRNKNTGRTIYVPNVEFTGNGDNTFENHFTGNYAAYETTGATAGVVPRGQANWYVMAVYTNPMYPNGRAGLTNNYQTYDVGAYYAAIPAVAPSATNPAGSPAYPESPVNPIAFFGVIDSGAFADSSVEIPFLSDWVAVDEIATNNFFRLRSTPIKLKPQGSLLRFDITNDTPYKISIEGLQLETNVVHSNIQYDLSPNNLPAIGTANSNEAVKWTPRQPTTTSYYQQTYIMGNSFTFTANFLANKNLSAVIGPGEKAKTPFFVWVKVKTAAEVAAIGSGNSAMTAVYLNTKIVDSGYVTARAKDYETQVADGKKPAPGFGWNLDFCTSRNQMRDGSNKPIEKKIIPLNIRVVNRPPIAIEMMAQNNVWDPSDPNKLTFAEDLDQVRSQSGDSRYVLPWSKFDTSNVNAYRIKKPSGGTYPKFHLPRTSEWNAVISPKTLKFAGFPDSKAPFTLPYTPTYGTWTQETNFLSYRSGEVTRWANYTGLTAAETAKIAGNPNTGDFVLSVRGVKSSNGSTFEDTDDMSLNLFSYGYNAFFIETIPISRNYVTRLRGEMSLLLDYWKTDTWAWTFYKETKITRQIRYVSPVGNNAGRSGWAGSYYINEPNDALYLISGPVVTGSNGYTNSIGFHRGDIYDSGSKKQGIWVPPFKNWLRAPDDYWGKANWPARMFLDDPWPF